MMQQDMALNFSPDIPEDMADLVMEGFEGLPRVSVPNEEAKKTAGLTIIKMLVTGMVMALLAGAFVKFKLFGGGQ
jgi:hypothetical protein